MKSPLPALILALLLAPSTAAAGPTTTDEGFRATMDEVFGPGAWRQTSGYRTPAHEDALRRQGAGTVPVGRRSSHSTGSRRAPGAYDAVVPGMSQAEAAARLRRASRRFHRVVAERRHGAQGPHLHIELRPGDGAGSGLCDAYRGQAIHVRIVNGRRNPLIACEDRRRAVQRPEAPASGLLD